MGVPTEHPFMFSEEHAAESSQACADHQLEGIVSKLASSKYRSGRSNTWLKTKCFAKGSFARRISVMDPALYPAQILSGIMPGSLGGKST